jgi:hypothetical protein
MDDIGGVDVFETTEDLINEVLDVLESQGLFGINDAMEISFHQIL